MSITKLHVFSKDTDAPATEQGFYYQKLKTLKTWLENRINGTDEVIYCDYEEDIFVRNVDRRESKFRQIKLYSTNFSFSRDEIQKSLAHFFMLFVKGDYIVDEVTFLFETNSGIARATRDNEADLLREWWQKQESIDADLLTRCKTQVKQIIDNYIESVYQRSISVELKAELQQAKNIYNHLPEHVWEKFIRSVKWQFDGVEQQQAIPLLLADLEALMLKLPLPIKIDQLSTYVSILHFEIANRTAQTDDTRRILTNELLDILILNEDTENKWYVDVYQRWLYIDQILIFNIGAFYEVITAARHCRWKLHKSDHYSLWLDILYQYIEIEEILIVCKRKAIYEYLFLLISPDPDTGYPKGLLTNEQQLIQYYFNEFDHRYSLGDIEEDITLFEIIQTHQFLNNNFLDQGEIKLWSQKIEDFINENIIIAGDADKLCQLYELKGHYKLHQSPSIPLKEKIGLGLDAYRHIIPLLKDVKLYTITRLYTQLNQILELLIRHEESNDILDPIENFINEIEDFATQVRANYSTAQNLSKRVKLYFEKPSTSNYLKALDCLHKAKDIWFSTDTREGYILSLINIANTYSKLGMNFAAKYYGLSAVRACTHFGGSETFKHISTAYAIVLYSDFQQGAWISTLDDFEKYLVGRTEFNFKKLSLEEDNVFCEIALNIACVLAAIPIIQPELTVFIDHQKSMLGWIYTDYLQILVDELKERFNDGEAIKKTINGKLFDHTLSDLGKERVVRFNIFDIEWNVCFSNNAIMNAIGEEFCSLFQITLCEIAMLRTDMHFLQLVATINIIQGESYTNFIKQRPDHDNSTWDIFIPSIAVENKDPQKINFHYSYLTINIKTLLNELSLLPDDEFKKIFDDLYISRKLGSKQLAMNSYQAVYFTLFSIKDFDKSMRSGFVKPIEHLVDLPHLYSPEYSDSLSEKYNETQSIDHISIRYQNLHKKLEISLKKWLLDIRFLQLIKDWRKNGWLDWQILIALNNFVIGCKATIRINETSFPSEEERRKSIEMEIKRLESLSEQECYIDIPISWLKSEHFNLTLQKVAVDTLNSYGLENKMIYPNFSVVRSFLNKRFLFNMNDKHDINPLRFIP
ncbi:hypothetical protein QNI19_38680 [Cytophagaceae bacterium DM2B3-1]|uniref:DUF4297 domain-containing protein n=1 Tax=Xanthocytophaga flava TaxID=3048013 RepID=A0ABT7CYR1_9BACT|nr:hypothetical protein [Xanthocytophaga flavus]MDJ1498918.1 hypothetical protein [Xanthocytophaga flavus]